MTIKNIDFTLFNLIELANKTAATQLLISVINESLSIFFLLLIRLT